MTRGKYIVLEGPEGVGKTTQLLELARRLQAAGLPVRMLREPDSQSDLTARAIRQLTQDPRYPMNTRTEVLLYNAARAQSLDVIRQSVDHGVICVVDRNYLTTLAIQYYGRGDVPDYETINKIITFAVAGNEPDLCILLDAPVPVLRERLGKRYNGERFDNLDDAFLERVRSGYLWEAHQRQLPVVFATEDAESVANHIWQLVSENLAIRETTSAEAVSKPTPLKEIISQKNIAPPSPTSEGITPETPSIPDTPPATGSQIVFENISNLLTLNIKQERRLTYQRSEPEAPAYYVPEGLSKSIEKRYTDTMDSIIRNYEGMLQNLTQTSKVSLEEAQVALAAVLPHAFTTTLMATGNPSELDRVITQLTANPLPEAQEISQSLLEQQEGSSKSRRAVVSYQQQVNNSLQTLAKDFLPDTHATSNPEPVTLVDYWPKNELVLAADMLYEQANIPLEELQSLASDWPYDRKNQTFKAYFGERTAAAQLPGPAIEKAHYSFDLLCDSLAYRELQRDQGIEDLTVQTLTPRYGYDMSKFIENAGLSEQFEECFDLSLKLYSDLQQAGYQQIAAYAVLQGHKLRCKLTYNGRTAFGLLETAAVPVAASYQALTRHMHEKIAEVHPLLAEAIQFVPQSD